MKEVSSRVHDFNSVMKLVEHFLNHWLLCDVFIENHGNDEETMRVKKDIESMPIVHQ